MAKKPKHGRQLTWKEFVALVDAESGQLFIEITPDYIATVSTVAPPVFNPDDSKPYVWVTIKPDKLVIYKNSHKRPNATHKALFANLYWPWPDNQKDKAKKKNRRA